MSTCGNGYSIRDWGYGLDMAMGSLLRGLRGGSTAAKPAEPVSAPQAPRPEPGSEAMLSTLAATFEQSGAGWFWDNDADGLLTYVGGSLLKSLDIEEDALTGKLAREVFSSGEGGSGIVVEG